MNNEHTNAFVISINHRKSRKKLEYLRNQGIGAICVTSGANKHVQLTKSIVLVSRVFFSTALKKVSNQINDLNPEIKRMTQCISDTVLIFGPTGAR